MPDIPHEVREQVRQAYQQHGLAWLQQEVQDLDPEYWQEVDRQNPQRLMHCVEVCRVSGKKYSEFRRKAMGNGRLAMGNGRWEVEYLLVERPREELYDRINRRVEKMMEAGLLEEAKHAFEQLGIPTCPTADYDYSTLPNSVNTVGYKELLRYLHGEWTLDKAIEMIKQNSRHYAKRQMTWWRNRI
jgi:tRNA dimethylallyltransferase